MTNLKKHLEHMCVEDTSGQTLSYEDRKVSFSRCLESWRLMDSKPMLLHLTCRKYAIDQNPRFGPSAKTSYLLQIVSCKMLVLC